MRPRSLTSWPFARAHSRIAAVWSRFERAGFTVTDRHLRPAYPDEHPTDRFYLVGVGYS